MKTLKNLVLLGMFLGFTANVSAHCEIPCGIYNDSLRVTLLYEHITTIEKSMNQIITLEKSKDNPNQLIRWVTNKEDHAVKMQEIISQYFMHQRIKPKEVGDAGRDKYVKQLELMHRLSILAMKSKQSTNLELIGKMRDTLHLFEHAYFAEEEGHHHLH